MARAWLRVDLDDHAPDGDGDTDDREDGGHPPEGSDRDGR
jgi:hypothetical protein